MKQRRIALLVVVVLFAPVLAGCGTSSDNNGTRVVASFYPLQFIADKIVGDHAEVTNLTQPGLEPHDLDPTPRQIASIVDADVVFYETGLQPAVDKAVQNNAAEHGLDVTDLIALHSSPEVGGADPHVWQDPALMIKLAKGFTATMVKADPESAADYKSNLTALTAELHKLDADFRSGLKNCAIRTLVVSHDAFEYLGRAYDLDIRPISGLSPDAEPSPAHLAELHKLVQRDQVTTVFSETLASPKMADTLAHDLGIETEVLDPLEGLKDTDSGADYLSVMRNNLAAIQKANRCS